MILAGWLLLTFQGDLAPPVVLTQRAPPAAQACPAEGDPVVRRLAAGGIRYCGRIDDGGVQQVSALLEPGDRRLVITSVGGGLDAPLALASLVLRRHLDVEVAGPCFSGCASLVFIAGNRRIVSPTAVLGFHNTNTSAFLLSTRIFGERTDIDIARLQRRSSEEMRVYGRRGIDPSLLVRPQFEIGTLCVGRAPAVAGSGETVFNLTSRLDLWAPDLATLRDFGVELTGDYPVDLADVDRRLERYLGRSAAQLRFRFGGSSTPSRSLYRRFYGIVSC